MRRKRKLEETFKAVNNNKEEQEKRGKQTQEQLEEKRFKRNSRR